MSTNGLSVCLVAKWTTNPIRGPEMFWLQNWQQFPIFTFSFLMESSELYPVSFSNLHIFALL